jgi:hypothetical protein
MNMTMRAERRLLSQAELEAVEPTHYPAICALSRQDLLAAARRLRELRDRARDISRQQRREMRGKAEARGASPARDNTGTSLKKQVLAKALKRVNRELQRREEIETGTPPEALHADRMRRHPSGRRNEARPAVA